MSIQVGWSQLTAGMLLIPRTGPEILTRYERRFIVESLFAHYVFVILSSGGRMPISMDEVRRCILIGLFSDDELMDRLVLKGGNALALVYKVAGSRASLDMDFSLSGKFRDIEETRDRIFRALREEFRRAGYILFDEKFSPRPIERRSEQPDWWGGYSVEFKLASLELHARVGRDIDALRRESEVLGPAHTRKYTIDISSHEFCEEKVKTSVDDFTVYVYSLEMIISEKLRAICQQLPDYELGNKRPRARDFYDIHQILAEHGFDMRTENNMSTLRSVFDAKKVPLDLLARIHEYKSYHEQDWASVVTAVADRPKSFDFYFDYVVRLAESLLKAARIK